MFKRLGAGCRSGVFRLPAQQWHSSQVSCRATFCVNFAAPVVGAGVEVGACRNAGERPSAERLSEHDVTNLCNDEN